MQRNDKIIVTVVYATTQRQVWLSLYVKPGATIHRVIAESGLLNECSELSIENLSVGIWGRPTLLSEVVRNGDRVEIYRHLLIDPKEERKKRA